MNLKRILKDIRFWIIIFFILRLIGITYPPLEVGHNWRQTTVTMVARNFLEVDNNIFFPRLDIAGEKSGITGMEFPLFNYMIYVVAEIFGYQHWYGRLINLIISSIGLCFFYKLIRKYFSEQVAFYSTIILTVSIWFQFSRKIMPDTFSMSLIIAAIYYGTNYLDNTLRKNSILHLLAYVFLMLFGVLSKLPSGFLLIIFGLFYFDKKIPLNRKAVFAAVSFIGIVPVIAWYFYWVPYLVEKYQFFHFFMGKSFTQGFYEILDNLNLTLSRFYNSALKFVGFTAFVFGLIMSFVKNEKRIYLLLFISLLSFALVIFKAGYTFPHHNYYIIPFVPVMALVAGYGLSKIKYSNIALIILIAISIEGIASQLHGFRIREKDKRLINLEKDLDKVSQQNDLIIISSRKYPTPMYFAHRKGWVSDNIEITDVVFMKTLQSKGLKFLVVLKRSFGSEISLKQYKKVLENEDYCIYELQ